MEILGPREVPLGGLRAMTVRRTLPQRQRTFVGAWCFVDHYGPDPVDVQGGMVVPPHPHTGLQTASWLFTGEVEHRDSAGHHAFVRPGELNLMTAGRGISHSEYSTPGTSVLHGAQLWLALPEADRFTDPTFEHHVPEHSALIVRRCDAAGALMIGKSNTPEFGAGSHTFNDVFGMTRNPWDLSKSAGGSSGGAAASVVCGMNPLACGSDMGGSLRNPAAWNGVVGLRPSPGTAAYGAAKAAVLSLVQSLAVEWAPKVRVVAISPGPVLTEQAELHYGDAAGVAAVEKTIPMQRMATPADIGDACVWLASDGAAYVTGSNLVLHGGGERPAFLDAANVNKP